MSASSAAASSSLTRPTRTGILMFGILSVACAYYLYQSAADFDITSSNAAATGLHRSNAVHRRRSRTLVLEEGNETEQPRAVHEARNIAHALADGAPDATARPLGDGETVVDDPDDDDDDDWASNSWDEDSARQRNGQNIVQLLFRVSEDATRRNAYVHRGCQCNSCGTVPIRGVRYRCSNCADFDLCEACEAQGLHIKTHIFYKVRVPTAAFAARQMQPVWYPGDPDTCMKMLPRDLITKLSKETGFERPELDAYWEQWAFMANTEWREDPDDLCLAMDRKTFDQCLVPSGGNRTAPNLIHDRMFAFYDQNNDDLISFPEFLNGLAYRRKKDKLKRIFEGYDINGDGMVDRKDFLRMFRSYYVLYQQMHRDMLDGLDDQIMNSTDAHQLVTSRQPLSGAFGRDGRFPAAPDPRSGEGKSAGVEGDIDIIDGKGVISESSNDYGNKEDVLIDATVREYYRNQERAAWNPARSNTYWRAVSNPPETIVELQHNVLEGLIRERQGEVPQVNPPPPALPAQTQDDEVPFSDADPRELSSSLAGYAEDSKWPPSFVILEDVKAVCGDDVNFENMQRHFRIDVLNHAAERVRDFNFGDPTVVAYDEIHERWKRRRFYTDEEEGASAPPGWMSEEDIPDLNGKAAENLQPISPRSRSSSKVRFADDDDYDTRSNASTSSRSIAERWGGMDIPEAEKDAGREIMYQVTQQAFNEMLDPLFRRKEDLAVAALQSKDLRDKHRMFFTDPLYEQWAAEVDKTLKGSTRRKPATKTDIEKHLARWGAWPTIPDIKLPEDRRRSLEELLDIAGYHISPSKFAQPGPLPGLLACDGNKRLCSHELSCECDGCLSHDGVTIDGGHRPAGQGISPENGSYRDPTLPQFRPNTAPDEPASSTPAPPRMQIDSLDLASALLIPILQFQSSPISQVAIPSDESDPSEQNARDIENTQDGFLESRRQQPENPTKLGYGSYVSEQSIINLAASKAATLQSMAQAQRAIFECLDWIVLYKLRKMEMTALEGEERGGWGRINWVEFEEAVKGRKWEDGTGMIGDGTARSERWTSTAHVVEYLGTWIDFCIPP